MAQPPGGPNNPFDPNQQYNQLFHHQQHQPQQQEHYGENFANNNVANNQEYLAFDHGGTTLLLDMNPQQHPQQNRVPTIDEFMARPPPQAAQHQFMGNGHPQQFQYLPEPQYSACAQTPNFAQGFQNGHGLQVNPHMTQNYQINGNFAQGAQYPYQGQFLNHPQQYYPQQQFHDGHFLQNGQALQQNMIQNNTDFNHHLRYQQQHQQQQQLQQQLHQQQQQLHRQQQYQPNAQPPEEPMHEEQIEYNNQQPMNQHQRWHSEPNLHNGNFQNFQSNLQQQNYPLYQHGSQQIYPFPAAPRNAFEFSDDNYIPDPLEKQRRYTQQLADIQKRRSFDLFQYRLLLELNVIPPHCKYPPPAEIRYSQEGPIDEQDYIFDLTNPCVLRFPKHWQIDRQKFDRDLAQQIAALQSQPQPVESTQSAQSTQHGGPTLAEPVTNPSTAMIEPGREVQPGSPLLRRRPEELEAGPSTAQARIRYRDSQPGPSGLCPGSSYGQFHRSSPISNRRRSYDESQQGPSTSQYRSPSQAGPSTSSGEPVFKAPYPGPLNLQPKSKRKSRTKSKTREPQPGPSRERSSSSESRQPTQVELGYRAVSNQVDPIDPTTVPEALSRLLNGAPRKTFYRYVPFPCVNTPEEELMDYANIEPEDHPRHAPLPPEPKKFVSPEESSRTKGMINRLLNSCIALIKPLRITPNSEIRNRNTIHVVPDDDTEIEHRQPSNLASDDTNVWAKIYNYEYRTKLGIYKECVATEITVDGYCDPDHPARYCIGAVANGVRVRGVADIRRQIGKGILLKKFDNDSVTMQNLSEYSVFLQCANLARKKNEPKATVYKIAKSTEEIELVSENVMDRMLLEAIPKGYKAVHALGEYAMCRMSFIKGFGEHYQRKAISDTPCWIEIHFMNIYKRIDEALSNMQASSDSSDSFS